MAPVGVGPCRMASLVHGLEFGKDAYFQELSSEANGHYLHEISQACMQKIIRAGLAGR